MRVPAKVNMLLGIGEARADGYHELRTVFHAVDLHDVVTVSPADRLTITVSDPTGAPVADVPTDATNLAWRAAALLAETAGVPARAHIDIVKDIPVAGGMAGGSADAAAALVACARLWDLGVTATELLPLAARLGSDVAFPLFGGTALGEGRGERLTPVPTALTLHWVFALAGHGLSTAAAYTGLDALRTAGQAPAPIAGPERLIAALADGDLDAVAGALGNDLQAASLRIAPALADTLAAARTHGALAGLVSGSGPTCAFLCRDAADAARLAAALEQDGVCARARATAGPVPGATVLDAVRA